MTATASTVRGYWDFEKTKDDYGFRLNGINGVLPGKSLEYLSINAGGVHWEKSDASVAEFIMYKGGLDKHQVSFICVHHERHNKQFTIYD